MKDSFNGWSNLANLNLENVVDLVLTNGKVDTIESDMWLIDLIGKQDSSLSILDFGFGIGRNIFQFSEDRPKWKFVGYDSLNMMVKSSEYSKKRFGKNVEEYSNVELIDDWQLIKSRKFDCIYVTIVFQHIFEKDLNQYLNDIKRMTKRLVVSGRRFNDDMVDGKYKNTWQILENNGFYPSNALDIKYSIEGDPEEHITCIYDI